MIRVEPDERCLRGLAERIVLPAPLSVEVILTAVRQVLGAHCFEATETWGARTVHRLIVQFRVEVRVGESETTLSLHHRQSAPPDDRRQLVGRLVESLSQLGQAK